MRYPMLVLAALLVAAPRVWADNVGSNFGAVHTAKATGKGQTTVSGTIGVTDNTAFLASVNYGLGEKVDGRIRVGMVDYDFADAGLAVAGDVRFQIWDEDRMGTPSTGVKQKPFDMALGGFMEWTSFDSDMFGTSIGWSVFQIGGQMSGSHTIHFTNGGTLAPYGRVNLRYEAISIDLGPGFPPGYDTSDSHLALGLNGGVAWGPTRAILLFAELQIDGNDGLFLGIDYRL